MGFWSDLVNNLSITNIITGRKNSAANVREVFAGVADAIQFLEGLARGAKILHGPSVPDAADGIDGDAYLNSTTSDFYFKELGDWNLVVVLRGQPGTNGNNGINGRTPVLGVDYTVTNGSNGLSAYQLWVNAGNQGNQGQFLGSLKGEPGADGVVGNRNRFAVYAPTTETGNAGDVWFYSISATKMAIYECLGVVALGSNWRLMFTSPDAGTITTTTTGGAGLPAQNDLTAGKVLKSDGTTASWQTDIAGTGAGAAVVVDANLNDNPISTVNAASVKAVNDGLVTRLAVTAKATSADIAAGTDDTKYITPAAAAAGTTDIAVYLQDIPTAVASAVSNASNWNAANQYIGATAIPVGLVMKVYFTYPTDPTLPAYKYEFWPNQKVVRYKLTN